MQSSLLHVNKYTFQLLTNGTFEVEIQFVKLLKYFESRWVPLEVINYQSNNIQPGQG